MTSTDQSRVLADGKTSDIFCHVDHVDILKIDTDIYIYIITDIRIIYIYLFIYLFIYLECHANFLEDCPTVL